MCGALTVACYTCPEHADDTTPTPSAARDEVAHTSASGGGAQHIRRRSARHELKRKRDTGRVGDDVGGHDSDGRGSVWGSHASATASIASKGHTTEREDLEDRDGPGAEHAAHGCSAYHDNTATHGAGVTRTTRLPEHHRRPHAAHAHAATTHHHYHHPQNLDLAKAHRKNKVLRAAMAQQQTHPRMDAPAPPLVHATVAIDELSVINMRSSTTPGLSPRSAPASRAGGDSDRTEETVPSDDVACVQAGEPLAIYLGSDIGCVFPCTWWIPVDTTALCALYRRLQYLLLLAQRVPSRRVGGALRCALVESGTAARVTNSADRDFYLLILTVIWVPDFAKGTLRLAVSQCVECTFSDALHP